VCGPVAAVCGPVAAVCGPVEAVCGPVAAVCGRAGEQAGDWCRAGPTDVSSQHPASVHTHS